VKSGNSASGVVLRGLQLESAFQVITLAKMKEGKMDFLQVGRRPVQRIDPDLVNLPGIIIGKELAKNLGIFLYQPIGILSPTGTVTPMGMAPRMKRFLVVGIFDSGFYEYDSTLAFLSLKDSQEFLNMGEQVTGVEIRVNNIYKADVIAKAIERKLGFPYWARHWMEMNKNLFAALRLEKRVMFIILSLIVLVAAFNIITTLIMVVMEKNKDIAILKSMGATSGSIMKIFILQGVIIGAIGTLLGAAGGITVALNLSKISVFVKSTGH
jgi:lipoprotein-releasing system permease protein